MDIDEAVKKLIYRTTMTLPGFEQLIPRSQIHLQYEYKEILKEYTKDLLTTVTKEDTYVTKHK